ncbi:hydroxypyruvate isomerase family protein [Rhizobium rhizogenes]|uniref:hydroxypyruvate isomerase family protein n=1 Tax=Rhizobium rhizogenes TaxID=359 RepID=UPI001573F534|nr:TIM barrel protein [Rhizobium rhizogenes]NTH21836.1 TIM barrel protein [Rhizobium rhizogenes]NTH34979.1 TIM barrel protein [Rhizobium rhizogenes]
MKFSANLSTLFQQLPLRERFGAAAAAGFNAVELWFPYEIPASDFRGLLADNNLTCVGINSAAGNVQDGDWGLATSETLIETFESSLHQAFRYASEIGCSNVHVMAGNVPKAAARVGVWQVYLRNISRACEFAEQYGITVMIEALNAVDRPNYLLNTQAQALEAIRTVDRANLKIMLDLFHLQRGEGNLIERMRLSMPHAAHIQIADNPGRGEPGTGEINFPVVFREIYASGYRGYVGCEYFPTNKGLDTLDWMPTNRLEDGQDRPRI